MFAKWVNCHKMAPSLYHAALVDGDGGRERERGGPAAASQPAPGFTCQRHGVERSVSGVSGDQRLLYLTIL